MKKPNYVASMLFTCPQCNTNFEFDAVGEYELVACPACGTRHVTVKVGSKLKLQPSELALMC
jgi:Zn finger protein HypA/HybF involved in hydrogenase expression